MQLYEVGISTTKSARISLSLFFFNDTATTEIYTLSLHDALPIYAARWFAPSRRMRPCNCSKRAPCRSEEHTSELQSRRDLVCRLLLEKKKMFTYMSHYSTQPHRVGCCLCHFLSALTPNTAFVAIC